MRYLRTLWVRLGFLAVLNSQVSVAQGLDFDDIQSDEPSFLPVEQAFAFSSRLAAWQLTLEWKIAPDYYLYQDRIRLKTEAGQTIALHFDRAAELKDDPNFGQVKIFHDYLRATADLGAIKPKVVEISYQGCSQAGLCYPVQKVRMGIDASGEGKILTVMQKIAAEPMLQQVHLKKRGIFAERMNQDGANASIL